jgi:uncharacterized protein (DUF1778 family)
MQRRKGSRTAKIEVRCSEELKNRLNHVAALQSRSVNDLIIQAASEKITQLLTENQVINLTLQEGLAFAEALANPQAPNEYLMESGQLYKNLAAR